MMAFVELVSGFWISQAMSVAARLGVADALTEEPRSIEELAEATQAHAPSLYRLMRTLASVGVFTEVEPRRFALTPVGEYLCDDNPDSLRYQAVMHGDEWHWQVFGGMLQTLKDGKPAIEHLHQVSSYWEYLAQHPADKSNFDRAMLGVAKNYHTPFIESYDFSGATKVIDVGGGAGTLIASILKAHPHLHGVLFDLPTTVAEGAKFLEREGVGERCETVGGDILQSIPSGGDLYTMSYVLPDWDDLHCITILKNLRAAMGSDSKLLLVDSIVPPGDRHSWVKWVDLFELCMGSGKLRTEAEFGELFKKTGLQLVRTMSMETPCSVMELIPA